MRYDTAVVGLGPNGLRVLACLAAKGFDVVGFERGRIAEVIHRWPAESPVAGGPWELQLEGGLSFPRCRQVARCTQLEYLTYITDVVVKNGLEVHDHEEVVNIKHDADSDFFLLESRRLAHDGFRQSFAKFVVLTTGVLNVPRYLDIPGWNLSHVMAASDIIDMDPLVDGKDVVVSGSGNTALLVALSMCKRGAKRVVICSSISSEEAAMGIMTEAFKERFVVTPWARMRYSVTAEDLEDDLNFMDKWSREEIFTVLWQFRRTGVLDVRTQCQVVHINTSHVELLSKNVTLIERADLVVTSHGFESDDEVLIKNMNFTTGLVSPFTGETGISGVYVIGFDLPGGDQNHFGDLPGGKLIYDNWLAWGWRATESTCEAIASRLNALGPSTTSKVFRRVLKGLKRLLWQQEEL